MLYVELRAPSGAVRKIPVYSYVHARRAYPGAPIYAGPVDVPPAPPAPTAPAPVVLTGADVRRAPCPIDRSPGQGRAARALVAMEQSAARRASANWDTGARGARKRGKGAS